MTAELLPASLVGSYPQPEWLIDREKLAGRFPPRVRAKELWRGPPPHPPAAQDDAPPLALPGPERGRPAITTHGRNLPRSASHPPPPPAHGTRNDHTTPAP